jgi:serine phosphatase RsbU (regulator of sigma subunit)
MFGLDRLQEALGGARTQLPLDACVEEVKALVEEFTGAAEMQDDLTLLMLRRLAPLPTELPQVQTQRGSAPDSTAK